MSDEENIDGLHQKIRTWLSTRVNLGAESTGFIPMHSDEVLKAVVDRVAFLESKVVVVDQVAFLESRVEQLREAISAWPVVPHWYDCGMFEKRGGFYLETECTCGVGAANAARAEARKLAGLED